MGQARSHDCAVTQAPAALRGSSSRKAVVGEDLRRAVGGPPGSRSCQATGVVAYPQDGRPLSSIAEVPIVADAITRLDRLPRAKTMLSAAPSTVAR